MFGKPSQLNHLLSEPPGYSQSLKRAISSSFRVSVSFPPWIRKSGLAVAVLLFLRQGRLRPFADGSCTEKYFPSLVTYIARRQLLTETKRLSAHTYSKQNTRTTKLRLVASDESVKGMLLHPMVHSSMHDASGDEVCEQDDC